MQWKLTWWMCFSLTTLAIAEVFKCGVTFIVYSHGRESLIKGCIDRNWERIKYKQLEKYCARYWIPWKTEIWGKPDTFRLFRRKNIWKWPTSTSFADQLMGHIHIGMLWAIDILFNIHTYILISLFWIYIVCFISFLLLA